MTFMNNTMENMAKMYSYHPMPFYQDTNPSKGNQKLDLNLHCIKRPQQTCFIQVTNPNLFTWGIEAGDILVVEKNDKLYHGDLVVLDINGQFQLYEVAFNEHEILFFSLDSKISSIKTAIQYDLPIVGTVTNTIHQIKPRNAMKLAA